MKKYIKADVRREKIVKIACRMANSSNYKNVRRDSLALACKMSTGNLTRIIGSMDHLRTMIIEYALTNGDDNIVAQAIVDNHPAIKDLSYNKRKKILTGSIA